MTKRVHRDVWLGAVLLVFCLWTLLQAVHISGQARYLPVALAVMMGVCAVCISIKGLQKSKEMQGDFQYKFTVKGSKSAFIFMGYIFLYYLLFRHVSYWIATPIFLLFTQYKLKVKSWRVNLIVTIVYIAICYVIFVVVLKLPIYKVGVLGRYFRYI